MGSNPTGHKHCSRAGCQEQALAKAQGEVMDQWCESSQQVRNWWGQSAGDKLSACWRELQLPCSSGQVWALKDGLKWSPQAMGRGADRYPLCRAVRTHWYPQGTGRLSTETLLPKAKVKKHIGLLGLGLRWFWVIESEDGLHWQGSSDLF